VVGRDDLTLGYGAYSELVQAYNSQELESLMQTILDYECDYVVVTKGHDMQLDVAYSNEDYLVYKAPQ
jgi:hydroxymethylpyrimidine/phosphomethylpyrimidine kinase